MVDVSGRPCGVHAVLRNAQRFSHGPARQLHPWKLRKTGRERRLEKVVESAWCSDSCYRVGRPPALRRRARPPAPWTRSLWCPFSTPMRFPSSAAAVACLLASTAPPLATLGRTAHQHLPMMSADAERATPPQPSPLQRSLVAVASSPWVSHQAALPLLTRQLISSRAQSIFAFVLAYLEEAGLDVDVHASGGYVRDLLLGRLSDDLDLTLCLIRCPPDVTIEMIAQGMAACKILPFRTDALGMACS